MQAGATLELRTALPWGCVPQRELGVSGKVGMLKRGQESPGHHPPGLAHNSPTGSAVLGTGHGLAREVRASRLPSGFFLCQACQSPSSRRAGQDSVHSPMGSRRGGERGPTAVLVPQPGRITNDASSQKSQAGRLRGMCQPVVRGSQMCSGSSRAAARAEAARAQPNSEAP